MNTVNYSRRQIRCVPLTCRTGVEICTGFGSNVDNVNQLADFATQLTRLNRTATEKCQLT